MNIDYFLNFDVDILRSAENGVCSETWRAALSAEVVVPWTLLIWAFSSIGCTLIGDAIEEPDTTSFLFSVAFEELTGEIIFWLNIWFIPAELEKGSLLVGVFTNRFSFEELA